MNHMVMRPNKNPNMKVDPDKWKSSRVVLLNPSSGCAKNQILELTLAPIDNASFARSSQHSRLSRIPTWSITREYALQYLSRNLAARFRSIRSLASVSVSGRVWGTAHLIILMRLPKIRALADIFCAHISMGMLHEGDSFAG